ncbi:MAG: hypothetical protein KDA86_20155 [Planctomycetaceae bacterium]|nr:hypothetical protein [Planctomycetaceae bacterium]
MSLRPFRFIHATNLRLDQPLWGIGSVNSEARRIAEDATLTAFQHIVHACIEHRVAFLLLTGNSFDAAHAYRARMTLEDACERLAEHDIEVLIVPGEIDPSHSWTKGLHLPSNVTTFVSRHSEPVAIVRDGEVLATVEPFERRHAQAQRGSHSSALRVGLIGAGQHEALQEKLAAVTESKDDKQLLEDFPIAGTFGYLALGNGSDRLTVDLPRGIAHDPGCPQPLDGRHTTNMGCSLIDVDRAGQLMIKMLPTAVVRREEIELKLKDDSSWDQLAESMQAALLDRDPLPTEKLWLIRWIIEGEGSLADSLRESSAQRELCELIEQELADDRNVIRLHEMDIRANWSYAAGLEMTGTVFEEFTSIIDQRLPTHIDQFRKRLPAIDWPEAGWVRRVIDTGERMSSRDIAIHTQHLARQWLLPHGTTGVDD